jgi:hypothetical protein
MPRNLQAYSKLLRGEGKNRHADSKAIPQNKNFEIRNGLAKIGLDRLDSAPSLCFANRVTNLEDMINFEHIMESSTPSTWLWLVVLLDNTVAFQPDFPVLLL